MLAQLKSALSTKESDPVSWKHVWVAIGASLAILGAGIWASFIPWVDAGWAGVGVAAAGAVALPQFLVAYWATVSEAAASKRVKGKVAEQNRNVQRAASVIWYGALVALVFFSGVVAGGGLQPTT